MNVDRWTNMTSMVNVASYRDFNGLLRLDIEQHASILEYQVPVSVVNGRSKFFRSSID